MNLKQQIKELREEIRNCGNTLRVDELRNELIVLEECYEKRIIRGRR